MIHENQLSQSPYEKYSVLILIFVARNTTVYSLKLRDEADDDDNGTIVTWLNLA